MQLRGAWASADADAGGFPYPVRVVSEIPSTTVLGHGHRGGASLALRMRCTTERPLRLAMGCQGRQGFVVLSDILGDETTGRQDLRFRHRRCQPAAMDIKTRHHERYARGAG